ncbi:MAG: glycosyltransferase family 9 protein, partial [Thermodesulfobacteriota bacterium]
MKKQKILILELGGIGDVVMALPALKGLVDLYRDDDLKILTVERTLPIVEQIEYTHPTGFNVESVDVLRKGGFLSWLGLIRRLKREGYDTVIDLSAIERYLAGVRRYLFLKLLSVNEAIGRNTDGLGWAYTRSIDETLTSSEHEVERKLRVAELLGIKIGDKRPEMIIKDEEREWAEYLLKDLPEKGLVIGMNPGAYRPSRMWSVEKFKEIAQWLVEELSASLLIMGGEKEKGLIENISMGLPEEKVVQCVGLAIPRLAAVMDRVSLLVTNDTGSMHVAAAVNTPIIALFGQTNFGRYHPYMDEERYVAIKKDCTVCPHTSFRNPMEECRRYSCNSQECMQFISVEEVKSAVQTLIKGLGGRT